MAIHVISKNTRDDLKLTPGSGDNVVVTLGLTAKGDGGGKLYYWDENSTATEDLIYNNVIAVTGMATGRYLAVYTRIMVLPHGVLFINNGKKEFFSTGAVVSSTGDCKINLTYDGTATGAALFTTVLFDDSKAAVNATDPNAAVSSCKKALTSDNKQLTHMFFTGSSATLVLGLLFSAFRNAAAGIPVIFKVEGI